MTNLGQERLLGIGVPVWIALALYGAGLVLLNRTRFGQAVFAIGGAEDAAMLMGLRVARVKIALYTLTGVLSGLAGMLVAARSSSGLSTIGNGLELEAIAAVVIGGTLLSGGAGGLTGTLIGVLLLGVIQNLINQVGTLRSFHQQVVSGLFLVVVVTAQTVVGRRDRRDASGCGSPSSGPASGGAASTPGVRPAPRRRAVRHRRTVEREDRAAGRRVRHHALRRPRPDARGRVARSGLAVPAQRGPLRHHVAGDRGRLPAAGREAARVRPRRGRPAARRSRRARPVLRHQLQPPLRPPGADGPRGHRRRPARRHHVRHVALRR